MESLPHRNGKGQLSLVWLSCLSTLVKSDVHLLPDLLLLYDYESRKTPKIWLIMLNNKIKDI